MFSEGPNKIRLHSCLSHTLWQIENLMPSGLSPGLPSYRGNSIILFLSVRQASSAKKPSLLHITLNKSGISADIPTPSIKQKIHPFSLHVTDSISFKDSYYPFGYQTKSSRVEEIPTKPEDQSPHSTSYFCSTKFHPKPYFSSLLTSAHLPRQSLVKHPTLLPSPSKE
ncbi:unnamed protein product [Ilex paraguariensis]|uniref:Uncharacterized protein n=1 Tax=Ilex paraguariensis TaxID=185542 RepID=A0ABC8U5J6_9AQUA